ncbi:hypothetical protein K491DRAFT_673491 [Lophiostoma macrostomum CBS 122681]|uniref:Uncharacterized protein n=1 Tax=Lophiostoma macrostomum CBS 122681 TaxID=1314788 RepID=A0A6A6TQ94_9PLEO|nr:hypothetical protein K491DRAFT_673491 [Lophiostoma macrostomum CBS 122681]
MRFATISISLAALASGALAATCKSEYKEFVSSYGIGASGVPDIPGTCGGLWDNLKQFADCIGVGAPYCGQNDNGVAGDLVWQFTNGANCNAGMVEATWWDATKNQWGAIDCP